jgi:hypothetical protein
MKRESKRFHSTLVEQTMLAAHDAVETAEEVAMAMKVVAKMPVQPCLGRHQRLVPARIQRGILLPSAQAIKATMVICSAFQWKKWLPILVPNMVIKLPRNGPAEKDCFHQACLSQVILSRHAARAKVTRECIELRLKSLRAEKMANEAKIMRAPTDHGLLKELHEVDNQIAKGDIMLNDEVEMKLTNDEKMAHSNAWCTQQETTESLKKSRGKVYSLLLGQCTQVRVDKMKQDADWVAISESFDPILLFKLIKKFVLKQFNNQCKTVVLIAK